jgi:hypothetical protein
MRASRFAARASAEHLGVRPMFAGMFLGCGQCFWGVSEVSWEKPNSFDVSAFPGPSNLGQPFAVIALLLSIEHRNIRNIEKHGGILAVSGCTARGNRPPSETARSASNRPDARTPTTLYISAHGTPTLGKGARLRSCGMTTSSTQE